MVVKSAASPASLVPPLPSIHNLQAAIRDTRKTPRGSELEILRTPRGSELEVLRTPRGSEILRSPHGTLHTPGGSEITKTPRGFTDSQKQTLLLPNSCESREHEEDDEDEEDEEDGENGTFKDARNSAELRLAQGLAGSVAQADDSNTKPGGGIIVDNPVAYEIGSSSKKRYKTPRHANKREKEIELKEMRANQQSENEGSNSPQTVRSFRDKLSLSLLPVVPMNREVNQSEQPLIAPTKPPLRLPIKKAPKNVVYRTKTTLEASKARVTAGSLRGVVLKVHATYMLAIVCFIAIMLASFIVSLPPFIFVPFLPLFFDIKTGYTRLCC